MKRILIILILFTVVGVVGLIIKSRIDEYYRVKRTRELIEEYREKEVEELKRDRRVKRGDEELVVYDRKDFGIKFKLPKDWKLDEVYNREDSIYVFYKKNGYYISFDRYIGDKSSFTDGGFLTLFEINNSKIINIGGIKTYILLPSEDYNFEDYYFMSRYYDPYMLDSSDTYRSYILFKNRAYKFHLTLPENITSVDKEIVEEYLDFLESIEFIKED